MNFKTVDPKYRVQADAPRPQPDLRTLTLTDPSGPSTTSYGRRPSSFCTIGSRNFFPINRFQPQMVFRGLVTIWFFAAVPRNRVLSLMEIHVLVKDIQISVE